MVTRTSPDQALLLETVVFAPARIPTLPFHRALEEHGGSFRGRSTVRLADRSRR